MRDQSPFDRKKPASQRTDFNRLPWQKTGHNNTWYVLLYVVLPILIGTLLGWLGGKFFFP